MAIAGKVAPTYEGDWSADKSYQQHTYVRYNGDAYIAIKASVGIEPTNEEYWFLALKNVSQAQLDALNNRIDQIQTTSSGTLSQAGWYRVAEYESDAQSELNGSLANAFEIKIKKAFSYEGADFYHLGYTGVYSDGKFYSICSDTQIKQSFTKIRHVITDNNAFIEVYYALDTSNPIEVIVSDGKDCVHHWQAITPVLTAETVDGVTVTTTYDIPSNASPVTDLDLAEAVDSINLGELHILESDLDTFTTIYGISPYWTYIATIRPKGVESGKYLFGGLSFTVIGMEYYGYGYQFAVGMDDIKIREIVNGTWGEWKQIATTTDLANYLPKSGGTLTNSLFVRNANGAIILENTSGNKVISLFLNEDVGAAGIWRYAEGSSIEGSVLDIPLDGRSTPTFNGTATGNLPNTGGRLSGDLQIKKAENGYSMLYKNHDASNDYGTDIVDSDANGNNMIFRVSGKDKKAYLNYNEVLHTGNSSPIVVSTTAPSDTNAVWYDTVNKMLKHYVDGAWQQ